MTKRRKLLLAVLTVAIVVLGWRVSNVYYWIGTTRTDLRPRVIDAETGQPMSNASAVVFRLEESKSEGKSDPEGRVTITHDFTSIGCDGLFTNTGSLYLWTETLRIEAEGYEPLQCPLEDYTGSGCSLSKLPLPPITVAMRKRGPNR